MENVTGVVIGGTKKSRLLGFPTANIEVSADLTSGPGIYAGYVVVEDLPTQAGLKENLEFIVKLITVTMPFAIPYPSKNALFMLSILKVGSHSTALE